MYGTEARRSPLQFGLRVPHQDLSDVGFNYHEQVSAAKCTENKKVYIRVFHRVFCSVPKRFPVKTQLKGFFKNSWSGFNWKPCRVTSSGHYRKPFDNPLWPWTFLFSVCTPSHARCRNIIIIIIIIIIAIIITSATKDTIYPAFIRPSHVCL